MLGTVLLFIILVYLYGYTVANIFKIKSIGFWDDAIRKLALGLGTFPIVAIIINFLRIPLHWVIFLVIPLVALAIVLNVRPHWKPLEYRFSKSYWKFDGPAFCALVLGILLFWMMFAGATSYPYLEDGDPWIHATSVVYIAQERTAFEPATFDFQYIDPYPPAYNIFMGILHQTNTSVNWTLKFFNALLVGLAIPIAYLYFAHITRKKRYALLIAFMLAVLPSFMSHFIWAQTWAVLLFFPVLLWLEYSIEKQDRNNLFIFSILLASVFVMQPSSAFIVVPFVGLRLLVALLYSGWKSVKKPLLASVGAGILSLLHWGEALIRYGVEGVKTGIKLNSGLLTGGANDTSGGIIYSFRDFLVAPHQSKMDQATGIGEVVTVLALIGLAYALYYVVMYFKTHHDKKDIPTQQLLFYLLLGLFTILGTMGNALPIKLFPHRFWVFLSIPVAFFAAYCIIHALHHIKPKHAKTVFVIGLLIAITFTSGSAKHAVQTSQWPPGGGFRSFEEVQLYSALEALPDQTKVFTHNPRKPFDRFAMGMDMYSPFWDEDIMGFRGSMLNVTPQAYTDFLKSRNYEYLIVGTQGFRDATTVWGENATQQNFNELLSYVTQSGRYTPVLQLQTNFVFRIN